MGRPVRKIMIIAIIFFFIGTMILILHISHRPDCGFILKPVYHFNTDQKVTALTFDDGPSSEWTPPLLDLLKKYSVKATFFVVGERVQANKDIVLRMKKEGHMIGQHTFHHTRMIFRSLRFMDNDIKQMDDLFDTVGTGYTQYFRPPFGAKLFALPYELKKHNKIMITWDVSPKAQYDRDSFNADEISSFIINKTKPGSIILLHDGWSGNPKPFLDAVEKTIKGLKSKGFNFITVEEGMKLIKNKRKLG